MTVVSTVSSCRDSCRQRSFPDEIICMRASNRTPLTRSQRSLTSDILRRPLSNHVLSASAEHVVVSKTVAIPKQSTRIDLPRYIIRKHYQTSTAALIHVKYASRSRGCQSAWGQRTASYSWPCRRGDRVKRFGRDAGVSFWPSLCGNSKSRSSTMAMSERPQLACSQYWLMAVSS